MGSSRLAVLASHTVVSAKGRAGSPACRVTLTTTGVSSTAVVSKDRKTVLSVAKPPGTATKECCIRGPNNGAGGQSKGTLQPHCTAQ